MAIWFIHVLRPQISLFLGHGHFGLDNISFLGARRPCVGAPRPYQGFAEIKHKQGETGVKLFCIFDSSVFFFITELSILIQCWHFYFQVGLRISLGPAGLEIRRKKSKDPLGPGRWTLTINFQGSGLFPQITINFAIAVFQTSKRTYQF